jgi:hypothetical protein
VAQADADRGSAVRTRNLKRSRRPACPPLLPACPAAGHRLLWVCDHHQQPC